MAVASARLSAVRQAVGSLPLPPPPPPPASTSAGSASTSVPQQTLATFPDPSAQFVPNPIYQAFHEPNEPIAAWILPKEEVKKQDAKFGHLVQVSQEPGWARVGAPGLDRESMMLVLVNVLASMTERSSPHSTAVGSPLVTVGPPGWRDSNLARWCEIDYDQLRERVIQMERLRWWIRTPSSWRSIRSLTRPVAEVHPKSHMAGGGALTCWSGC